MIWNAEKLLQDKEKAIRKIAKENSWGDLYNLLKAAKDDDVRRLLVQRMHALNPGGMYDVWLAWRDDAAVRGAIFDVTDDEAALFRMAVHPDTCPEAVDRLKWQEHLVAVVKQFRGGKSEEYALRALRRIEDRAALRQFADDRFQSDGVRRECVRRLAASQEDVCRMAAAGEGCLPALDLLDREHLIRLAGDRAVPSGVRVGAVERIGDEEQVFRIGEAARSQGDGEVLKAAARCQSDPKRRCALGVHDFVPVGETYGRQDGDTRYVCRDLRCAVCGIVVQDTADEYKF